jgi:tetratricopeptide (TPR) repeat protein/mono/diheme cytochrome c family protein
MTAMRPVTEIALLALAGLGAGCGGDGPGAPGAPGAPAAVDGDAPTFARDVAPIVHAHCSTCHRPGEVAPFDLLDHDDVAKRARQVEIVVSSRYMPPWLPRGEPGVFDGDRSLSDAEIETVRAWVAAGAPEGDPGAAPAAPEWSDGWQLGEPDLVVSMPRTFTLPAEGRDLYRNFVVPAPLASSGGTRWVSAVEWRPTNRPVVHHAGLFVERSGAARALEAADPVVGYGGMSAGPAEVPDGVFVGWAPGKVPRPGEPGIAWKLDERTDLVVQLHMRPTGKPEEVGLVLGLHFADAPPTRRPVSIRLVSLDIDIPPGEAAYLVEDAYTLPVDLEVLGVYPHAHYLGRELEGFALLPDGTRRTLVRIPRWDFNWQDEYYFREPLALPAGTELHMRYTFDNSEENELNPSSPPRRVVYGEQSDDEMAELLLMVLPSAADLPILWRDFAWKKHGDAIELARSRVEAEPRGARWRARLGSLLVQGGRPAEALPHYERWVALRPGVVNPLVNLGHAQLLAGELDAARVTLARALELEPGHAPARVDLARALIRSGETGRARIELERALRDVPGYAEALVVLGDLLAAEGDRAGAEERFRQALALDPEHVRALWSLGRVVEAGGARSDAIGLYREALRVYPDEGPAHHLLGLALAAEGDRAAALEHLAIACRLAPGNAEYGSALRRVQAQDG